MKSKVHTGNGSSKNKSPANNTESSVPPGIPRPPRFTTGPRDGSKHSSGDSLDHSSHMPGTPPMAPSSPTRSNDHGIAVFQPPKYERVHKEQRISVLEEAPFHSPLPRHFSIHSTTKEKRKAQRRQKEVRAMVKSINYPTIQHIYTSQFRRRSSTL